MANQDLPLPGNDNWLSDTKNNAELSQEQLAKLAKAQRENKDELNITDKDDRLIQIKRWNHDFLLKNKPR